MRGHVVSVEKRDVGRGLHPEPHRVDLRKMGSVRRRKAEKGDERQQHGGKGTQETSVKWTSTG